MSWAEKLKQYSPARFNADYPPTHPQHKIEKLLSEYPIKYSLDIWKEWQRHEVKNFDYMREFMNHLKRRKLEFCFVCEPLDNKFRNFQLELDGKLNKFPECKIVHYIEHTFPEEIYESAHNHKHIFIFFFSNYVDQERKLLHLLEEFYTFRNFI